MILKRKILIPLVASFTASCSVHSTSYVGGNLSIPPSVRKACEAPARREVKNTADAFRFAADLAEALRKCAAKHKALVDSIDSYNKEQGNEKQ